MKQCGVRLSEEMTIYHEGSLEELLGMCTESK